MKKDIFLEKARAIHGYRYKYPNIGSDIMQMDIIDVVYENVIYKQRVVKHFKGSRPEQKTKQKTTECFIQEAKEVWGNKYDYSLTMYKNARTKVKIIYDNIIYEQWPNGHLQKYPVEGYLDQEIFIQKSIKKWGNKYDYSLVKFKDAKVKVDILFNGVVYKQSPSNHLNYAPEKINRRTNEEFIRDSNLVHDFKYSYDKTLYTTNLNKVTIICPIHGDFLQTPSVHLRSGCPHCNESKGEKEISKFLNKYEFTYDRQHKFQDCKNIHPLPFDFYIPSKRTCIEFDGQQHFQPIEHFGGLSTYESLKINDKIKSDYCEENYIDLIRIRYDQFDDIYQILWNNLKSQINI